MRSAQFAVVLALLAASAACRQPAGEPAATPAAAPAPPPAAEPAQSLEMGGAKSVMTFFITSRGLGKGGDLGGLAGADAHCAALAKAEGAGDHTWRAYLSAPATDDRPAVHARDRIGNGPWYNAEGLLVAANVRELHGDGNRISKELATTERLDPVNGIGDTPNVHDILTGSRPDGTAYAAAADVTCRNWTSSSDGRAQVGHHDRKGATAGMHSWNSAHASAGCSQTALASTGGAGLLYCFGID
jgi:hypothetical protein